MMSLRFAHPWLLLLLLLLPLLVWFWTRPTRRGALRYASAALIRSAGGDDGKAGRTVLWTLRSLALLLTTLGAARPQTPDANTRVFAEGVAIELVVDNSSSMYDFDLSPPGQDLTRLDVVKQVVRRFVAGEGQLLGRANDLIGLIRFAGFADSVCPLTLDHESLLAALDRVSIVRSGQADEDGTAIGDGLGLGVQRLRDLKRSISSGEQLSIKNRVIVLLTDGENNRGMLTPQQAGDLAALSGIKVYAILAGTGARGAIFRQPVNDEALRYIARVTGGKFFHATDAGSLEAIYAEIDALERTRVEERRYTAWNEHAQPLLIAALACLALHALLEYTWLRTIP